MDSPRDLEPAPDDAPDQVVLGSLHLAPFDADAPTLTTPEGGVYIPIRWLCELLGLAPTHWIGVVCACYRGDTEVDMDVQETQDTPDTPDTPDTQQARRAPAPLRHLPYARSEDAIRQEWCLEWGRVVRWLSFHLDSRRVLDSLRHNQLRAFRKATYAATSAVYQRDQAAFEEVTSASSPRRSRRRNRRLRRSGGWSQSSVPISRIAPPLPPRERLIAWLFAALVAEGRTLHQEVLEALRATLGQMADLPVVDAFRVDAAGAVVGSLTLPIIPVTPDLSAVTRRAEAAASWRDHELIAWLRARGFIRPAPQREEAQPDEPHEPHEPGEPDEPDEPAQGAKE